MKKFSKIAVIILLPFVAYGLFNIYQQKTSTAQAHGHIEYDFGIKKGKPIFNVDDFKPGDCITKNVKVKNSGTHTVNVAIKSDNVQDEDQFGKALKLTISHGTETLYEDTLFNFFEASHSLEGVILGELDPKKEIKYDLTICFDINAGNEYQKDKVIFDLIFSEFISPLEIPAECKSLEGNITTKIEGQSNQKVLIGTKNSELIIGKHGNEIIKGLGGDDCIVAADNTKTIFGGFGNDIIIGSEGKNDIKGSIGNDIIYGRGGDDKLYGNLGDDTLYGGSGDDQLFGSVGNDKLYGEDGYDTLWGGTGKDTCISGEKLYSCEL